MNNALKVKGLEYAEFLKTLTPEQIEHANAINYKNAEDEFIRFNEHFDLGTCYLCKMPISSFSSKLPCPHWLLLPQGFKKKYLPALAEKYGFYQIQSFLRWVANREAYARNINDLEVEGTGKLFEVTIKYKNIEWAFSCAESDYQGHPTSEYSKNPHYHFQLRLDNRPFINYGDYHLPFSEMDIINIEAIQANPSKIKQRFSFGEGMNDILADDNLEHIINSTVTSEDENEGDFKFDSIAIAEEGKTISGEDIYALFQESKSKGVAFASLMHKLPNARSAVIVSLGSKILEQAPRGKKNDA